MSYRRASNAWQGASRYTIYLKYISLLESNQQAERARSIRSEAIEKFEEADKADHSLFLRLVHDQLAIYREQQNVAATDELHATVIGKFRRIFGTKHRKTITAMHEYGQMLCNENRYELAEALYETLVQEVDHDHELESVAVLCIFNALGTVYKKRQKLKEAEGILTRATVGYQRQCGETDSRTLVAAFNLAGVYQDLGKLSHAIRMYHGAAYGFKDMMGISYKTTITAFTHLAALCSARRALPEAEEAYTMALKGLKKAARQDSIDSLILRLDLGILYRDTERLEAAEKLMHEVYQGLKDAHSGYAPGALTCLATIYARQGRAGEAETSFADAARDFATCEEQYSAMSYANSFGLGNLLHGQRRSAEAEALYQRAWDGALSVGGPKHTTSCTIAQALGSLYEQQGKYEEAEDIYKKSLKPQELRLDRWTDFVLSVNFHKMVGFVGSDWAVRI